MLQFARPACTTGPGSGGCPAKAILDCLTRKYFATKKCNFFHLFSSVFTKQKLPIHFHFSEMLWLFIFTRHGYELCDEMLTDAATKFLKNLLNATEKSYTFFYLGNVDSLGHNYQWCSSEYNDGVDVVDSQVMFSFGCFYFHLQQLGKTIGENHPIEKMVEIQHRNLQCLFETLRTTNTNKSVLN